MNERSEGARNGFLRSHSKMKTGETSAVKYRSISAEFDVFRANRRRKRALSRSPRRQSVSRSIDQQHREQHSTSPESHELFLLSTKVPDVQYGAAILKPSSSSSATLYSRTNSADDVRGMPPSSIQEGISLSELLNGRNDLHYGGNLELATIRKNLSMSTVADMDRYESDSSDNGKLQSDEDSEGFRTTAKYPTKFHSSTTFGTLKSVNVGKEEEFITSSDNNDSRIKHLHHDRSRITDQDILSYTSDKRFSYDLAQSVRKISIDHYGAEEDEINIKSNTHTSESNAMYTPREVRNDDASDFISESQNRHIFSPYAESHSSSSQRNLFQEDVESTPISAARHGISRIEMDRRFVASPILVPPRQVILPYQGRMIVKS